MASTWKSVYVWSDNSGLVQGMVFMCGVTPLG